MPEEVVVALIIQSNRILLGHRTPDREFYPDVWDVLGGHMEPGETQAQTLVRELVEELGIQATEYQYLETIRLPSSNKEVPDLALHLYRVTQWNGVPTNKQAHEHTLIEWFGLEDAVQLKLAHPDFPALFRKYFQSG